MIAPEAVLTVRTYATRRRLRTELVRNSTGPRPQTCRSQDHTKTNPDPVIRVRF